MRSALLICPPPLPLSSWLYDEESPALLFGGRFLQFWRRSAHNLACVVQRCRFICLLHNLGCVVSDSSLSFLTILHSFLSLKFWLIITKWGEECRNDCEWCVQNFLFMKRLFLFMKRMSWQMGSPSADVTLMVENEKDSVGCRNRGSIWQSEIVDHRVSSSAPSGRKASTEDAKVTWAVAWMMAIVLRSSTMAARINLSLFLFVPFLCLYKV